MMLRGYFSPSDECEKVAEHFYDPGARQLLAVRVFGGTIEMTFEMSQTLRRSIEASVPLAQAGITAAPNAAASSSRFTAATVSRPQGSLAVQLSKINVSALMYIYALKEENPETWVRLERLVEEYLAGREAEGLEALGYNLRGIIEDLGSSTMTTADLRELLFFSEGVEPVDDYAFLDIPQEVWDAVGVYAAAATIVGETSQ